MLDAGFPLRTMPKAERPRERLERHGAQPLSVAELIAVILGSGIQGKSVLQLAQEIVSHFGTVDQLARATVAELCQIKGLGPAKAVQLVAAFGLSERLARSLPAEPPKLSNPAQVYGFVRADLEEEKRELFVAILQDVKRRLIRQEIISVGTLSRTLVHPREVFYPAIRHKASSLIVVHNHPSGDPTPSPQDYELTRVLVEAGRLIGIPVTDHLIVGRNCYLSLREQGFEFE